MQAPAVPPAPDMILALPGLRTLRSPRFRMLVAGCLLLVGVSILGLVLVRQAANPNGQFGIDLGDYRLAAARVASGTTPYARAMLDGPVSVQGTDRYRYPPVLAQVLAPLSGLPMGALAVLWLLVQAAAVLAATWIATGAGGARASPERALWCAVAATWFLPVFDSLWKGNVSGILAFQVALTLAGGAVAGVSIAAAILLKFMPVALLPAAAGGGRRIAASVLAAGLALTAVSIVLSPGAWSDYARVLPNLLAGPSDDPTNLSPWAVLAHLGAPALLVDGTRAAGIAAGLLMAFGAYRVASRPGGWHAAVALGTSAMLLLPAAVWYHYLAVLLPLGAVAWPSAIPRVRVALVAGALMVLLGVSWLPLATAGAAVLAAGAVVTLLPGSIFTDRSVKAAAHGIATDTAIEACVPRDPSDRSAHAPA